MLTAEELKRVGKYWVIISAAKGDVTVLTPEETSDLDSLLRKWLEREHNPGIPQSILPEPYQTVVRIELRKMPTWKLEEAYEKLRAGEPTGMELVEKNRAYAISAIREVLWERGKLSAESPVGQAERLLPMPPEEGPPLPRMLTIKWPWRENA